MNLGGTKILAVCGASGGHIFPAVAFLESFKEIDPAAQALLVLPERSSMKKIEDSAFQVKYIIFPSVSLKLNSSTIKNLILLVKGFFECIKTVIKFKPDVAVGFGSLISLPVIITAWFLRINTIIHEQNVIPGRATRFLAFFARAIAISFAQSRAYFTNFSSKLVLTGNPLRKSLKIIDKKSALDYFGLKENKITILVSGGSQGSKKINFTFLNAVNLLENKERLQVIHLCGLADYQELKNNYEKSGVDYVLYSFFDHMQFAYSAADFVISRAGATSISEIIFYKLPGILLPYPYAYQHQYKNARVLEEKAVSIIIKDEELTVAGLKNNIEAIIGDTAYLQVLKTNFNKFGQDIDSGKLLAEEILRL